MSNQMLTLEDLEKLEARHRTAAAAASDATDQRNQAVLFLLEQGTRQNALASVLGITPGRVSQIADRARRQRDEGTQAAA